MNKTIEAHEISAACMMGFLEARLAGLENSEPANSARINEAREMLIQVEKTVSLLSGGRSAMMAENSAIENF